MAQLGGLDAAQLARLDRRVRAGGAGVAGRRGVLAGFVELSPQQERLLGGARGGRNADRARADSAGGGGDAIARGDA